MKPQAFTLSVARTVAALWLAMAAMPASANSDTPLNIPDNWFVPLTVAEIQTQLDRGINLNELNHHGSSVLVRAGNSMAKEDVWKFLIDNGAKLTEAQLEGREAIFWVTKGGTPEAVRMVLAHEGVNVNALDGTGRNAFAHATRLQPDLEVYRELIKAGVDINNRDVNGRTAMHEAAMRAQYVHLFEFFHSLGLRYDTDDKNGWDPFLNAAWRNPTYDVVVHLAKHSNINKVGKDGLNAAMLAAENNPNAKVLRFLLDQGLKVDGRDQNGATALVRAGRNSAEVAKLLMDMGQDVNATDNLGNTAFIVTGKAQTHAPALIRLLAGAGADVHAVNREGANALMVALESADAYKSGPQTIRLLIEDYGLKPTPKLGNGDTALTIAAKANQPASVLRLLVNAGADKDATGPDGRTALDMYESANINQGAIDYLRSLN